MTQIASLARRVAKMEAGMVSMEAQREFEEWERLLSAPLTKETVDANVKAVGAKWGELKRAYPEDFKLWCDSKPVIFYKWVNALRVGSERPAPASESESAEAVSVLRNATPATTTIQ